MLRQLRQIVKHFPLTNVQCFIAINLLSQARFLLSLFSSTHSLWFQMMCVYMIALLLTQSLSSEPYTTYWIDSIDDKQLTNILLGSVQAIELLGYCLVVYLITEWHYSMQNIWDIMIDCYLSGWLALSVFIYLSVLSIYLHNCCRSLVSCLKQR